MTARATVPRPIAKAEALSFHGETDSFNDADLPASIKSIECDSLVALVGETGSESGVAPRMFCFDFRGDVTQPSEETAVLRGEGLRSQLTMRSKGKFSNKTHR